MDSLVERMEGVLLDRGLTSRTTIDHWADLHADEVGPRRGAQAVAWLWGAGPDAARSSTRLLGRCGCGRRWRIVVNTATTHNAVLPGPRTCTGWRVLGAPPSWYSGNLYEGKRPKDRAEHLVAEHGVPLTTRTRIRWWTDDATTHHLVAPLRPASTEAHGPFELATLLSRPALRGFATPRADVVEPPSPGPEWAQAYPGYALDERALDRPWELRSVALALALISDSPGYEQRFRAELDRIAVLLPVRTSIYTAWLWALARSLN